MYDGEYDDLDSNDLSENDYSDEGCMQTLWSVFVGSPK